MKYLLLILLFGTLNCLGQDYAALISQHRENYKADFLKQANSPLKKEDLSFLRFYDADSMYRVKAQVEILYNEQEFVMPVFTGEGSKYIKYAVLKFVLNGKSLELSVYRNVALARISEYRDYLFLPFTDETTGLETYSGGRYLDLREGEIHGGTVTVDFNKTYNPYCAFSGGYACPKPPDENKLGTAVKAGEKIFAGTKKH